MKHPSILTRPDFIQASKHHKVLYELRAAAQLLGWPPTVDTVGIAGEMFVGGSRFLDDGQLVIEKTGFRIQGKSAGASVWICLSSLGMGDGPTSEVTITPGGHSAMVIDRAIHRLSSQLNTATQLKEIEERLAKLWTSNAKAEALANDACDAFVAIGKVARAEAFAAESER